jgi:hypothetical protein
MIQEPRYKTIAWGVAFWLFWGFVVLQATGSFIDWITGVPDRRAHEGQRCGPEHHWVYVGLPGDSDLSCEHDRP